jgi:hypothetical protein
MSVTTPPDVPAADSSAPTQPKRRGGAPAMNTNAVTHGAYLDEAKRTARATRDGHRRRAEKEARAVLVAAGLEDHPLAVLVSRQIRRLETVASRIEAHLEHRGYFDRKGDVKPSIKTLVDTTDRLLGEARRMLEQMLVMAPKDDGPIVFRILAADGADFALGPSFEPPAAPLPADPDGAVPPAIPPPLAAPQPAETSTAPLHPVDAWERQQAAARDRARAETLRAWASGGDVD